jgi:hypothetical protein
MTTRAVANFDEPLRGRIAQSTRMPNAAGPR